MVTEDIKCFGIGESDLATLLKDVLGVYEWGCVAPYVGHYEVIVRVTAWDEDRSKAQTQLEQIKAEVSSRLGAYIFGYNEDSLEDYLINYLSMQGYKIATVESCTGGLVAATLVSGAGASACFEEGVVTYSNEAKTKYAGVSQTSLKQFGAVSEVVAREMAEGIKNAARADIGLSTTGIAGPGGGTTDKPVGLVYIGIALKDQTYVFELNLKGSRTEIREKTVKTLLFKLYQLLK